MNQELVHYLFILQGLCVALLLKSLLVSMNQELGAYLAGDFRKFDDLIKDKQEITFKLVKEEYEEEI